MEQEKNMLVQMERSRRPFENTLQLIYDVCLPDDESIVATRSPGGKKRYAIYDTTAPRASKKFANFLHAIMMPEAGMWGNQRPVDDDLAKDAEVGEWFWNANMRISTALSNSNFYTASLETVLDYGVGGLGALYGQVNTKLADARGSRFKSLSFHAIPIANFFFLEATEDDDERGIIMGDPNRVARVLDMERFEIEKKFETSSDTLKDAKTTDKFRIVHLVTPNESMTGPQNRWRSQYILLGKRDRISSLSASDKMEQLSEGVLPRMPYFVPRMAQKSGEIWPRGFGMDVLQDTLEINVLTKHLLNSVGKDADPPTIVGHEAAIHLELIAGGVSYMDPDRFDQIKQLTSGANYSAVYARLDKLEQKIESGFLVDQLQLPPNLDRATAEEILRREEDSTRLLSSTFTKAERELPAKVHNWAFEEMLELGEFGDTPEVMATRDVSTMVMFDSPLANARRRRQLEPIRRYVGQKVALVQQTGDPSVMDGINLDAVTKMEQEIEGFDPRIFRSDKEVEEIRKQRQEAAARQEAREAAKAAKPAVEAAAMVKNEGLA